MLLRKLVHPTAGYLKSQIGHLYCVGHLYCADDNRHFFTFTGAMSLKLLAVLVFMMSERESASKPSSCSGDMYCSVPRIVPWPVKAASVGSWGNTQCLFQRQPSLLQTLAKRLALDVLHDEVIDPILPAHIENTASTIYCRGRTCRRYPSLRNGARQLRRPRDGPVSQTSSLRRRRCYFASHAATRTPPAARSTPKVAK
jgi:hypothetical protein